MFKWKNKSDCYKHKQISKKIPLNNFKKIHKRDKIFRSQVMLYQALDEFHKTINSKMTVLWNDPDFKSQKRDAGKVMSARVHKTD